MALEKLSAARPVGEVQVQIYLDNSSSENLNEVEYARDMFYPQAEILHANPHIYAPSGCWNILNAIKGGYETDADYVFLVEEDVMVYPNFFEWHLSNLENSVSCGRYLEKYKSKFYTNPGACFNRFFLGKIVPHICPEFFQDRRDYMNRAFGEMDEASDLDDGLIRRVIRKENQRVIYPAVPVVAHQGFHAYNLFQEYKNEGSIDQRITNLKEMLTRISSHDRYTKDFEPFNVFAQSLLSAV